jgi:hypothetical protein
MLPGEYEVHHSNFDSSSLKTGRRGGICQNTDGPQAWTMLPHLRRSGIRWTAHPRSSVTAIQVTFTSFPHMVQITALLRWAGIGIMDSQSSVFVQCARLYPSVPLREDWYAGLFRTSPVAEIMCLSRLASNISERTLVRPSPASNLRYIGPVLVSVVPACNLHIAEAFHGVRSDRLQPWHTLDDVHCEAVAVDFVHDR